MLNNESVTINTTVGDLNIALAAIEQLISPHLNVIQSWRQQAIDQLQPKEPAVAVTEDEGAAE